MSENHKQDILLESGTNEIEIMEFTIGNNLFGINVAKVREIIMPCPVREMPNSHPDIEGIIQPRDTAITLINLPKYLNIPPTPEEERNLFIVTGFNRMNLAFRVHTVVGIDRIYWDAIEKPDRTIYGGEDGIVTGLARCDGRLIAILDFEKIVGEISPQTSIKSSDIDALGEREESHKTIMVVEDSVFLEKMIKESLDKAGFKEIITFGNGLDAWEFIQTIPKGDHVNDYVSCIITDIEMPKMDGHRLTKLVKSDAVYRQIPVIIFSSLIDDEMKLKGEQLGADAQMAKPQIRHLVEVIDRLTAE